MSYNGLQVLEPVEAKEWDDLTGNWRILKRSPQEDIRLHGLGEALILHLTQKGFQAEWCKDRTVYRKVTIHMKHAGFQAKLEGFEVGEIDTLELKAVQSHSTFQSNLYYPGQLACLASALADFRMDRKVLKSKNLEEGPAEIDVDLV